MNKPLRRWVLALGLATAGVMNYGVATPRTWAQEKVQPDPKQQVAAVEQLKGEAFKALKSGQFDRTSELLSKAATLSNDPNLSQMSDWIHQFQSQRQTMA